MRQEVDGLLQSIYDQHQASLRRIAIGYGIPNCDIDDVMQETFISYFSRYSLSWTEKQKKAMLVKILKCKCIDFLRKNVRHVNVGLDALECMSRMDLLARFVVRDPLDIMVEEESYEEIKREIESMRPEWKEIAMLYFIEEMPIAEICQVLGIPGTVCRSRIYRVKCFLRKVLNTKYDFAHLPEIR